MVTNINTTPKALNTPASSTSTAVSQSGVVAKLNSEIQLIERLTPIKLQGSESLSLQGKSAQLIHASDQQGRQFSLLNQGPTFPSTEQQQGQLNRLGSHSATLTIPHQNSAQPPIQLNNLQLHSRVMNLTVTDLLTTPKNTSGHLVQVTDGTQSFSLLSQQPLTKGETIRAVLDTNQALQILPSQSTANTVQLEALKQSLPKQLNLQEMSQLIKQLQQLNQNPSQLSPQHRQALQQLISTLPDLNVLTQSAQGMKQAILNNGTFSESQLAQQGNNLNADLKLNLARLISTSEVSRQSGSVPVSLPTEQIANAIERITTTQLRHFSETQTAPSFPLYMDLAVQHGNSSEWVQIQIDQEESSNTTEQERRWLVKLTFDFEETGYFEARTSIQGNKVSVVFAAQNQDTVKRLQQSFPTLKERLQDKDIEVERLESFQAQLKNKQHNNLTPKHSLIDIKT